MYDTFTELGVKPEILKAVEDMGFEEPTPIQKAAIPTALTGKDLIGQAQTGTGKTAAFGIPILERIDISEKGPQAVVLSPTRELAIQSAEEINHLAQYLPIHALPIYGGQEIERQFKALRKHPNIIVATPGRLMDHMKRGTIDLSHVQILVLDEGDEMVDMGFIDDIRTILAGIPEERQTMFFSATMPAPIRELAETFLKEPEIVKIKAATVTIDLIEQEYIELPDRQKFDALCRLLVVNVVDGAIGADNIHFAQQLQLLHDLLLQRGLAFGLQEVVGGDPCDRSAFRAHLEPQLLVGLVGVEEERLLQRGKHRVSAGLRGDLVPLDRHPQLAYVDLV